MSATTEQIHEAILRTREARDRVQLRSTDAIAAALARAAKNWLAADSPWRRRAVEQAPATTGFSSAMVNEAVDLTFAPITEHALRELLSSGSPLANEGEAGIASAISGEREKRRRASRSHQHPQIIVHFLAGNVPAPGLASICCGLLSKSANLIKVSSRDPVFPALFVESVRAVDAELAGCAAVLDWRREEVTLTRAALTEADAVIAYGDDETIASIRRMTRPDAHFLGYGHKLSFAVIGKAVLTKENLPRLAEAAAFDASVYDQQGCLSPHAFYVEDGGLVSPRAFAAALAEAMASYQARVPRGELSVEEAAQVAKLRGAYEFRSASDKSVAVWAGGGTNDWLVIYEEDPMFTPSCLNRVVFVKPVTRLESIPQFMRRFASSLSTAGLAPMDGRTTAFAGELIKLGVSRVCPIGQMQRPRLAWQLAG
ncbi:MAG TPA: acyl-CoA reductase [Verrucomicrobiae bacterium]|nr:acyl-CoA reductase [Verrucomicrobiae bacterium]